MSDPNEWEETKKSKGRSSFISEPGVYLIGFKSITFSEEDPAYEAECKTGKKRRFLEFDVVSDQNQTSKIRMYRAKEGDTEKTKGIMIGSIKDLLKNAGADDSLPGQAYPRSVVGKTVNALFKQEEYIGYDATKNKMPVVKSIVKFSFSKPKNEQISANQGHLHARMKESELKKFEFEYAKWKQENPTLVEGAEQNLAQHSNQTNSNMSQSIVDDDLPF